MEEACIVPLRFFLNSARPPCIFFFVWAFREMIWAREPKWGGGEEAVCFGGGNTKSVRLSGKVSIDCGAIFKVGSCECLSFASICCLVGGWLLGGIY